MNSIIRTSPNSSIGQSTLSRSRSGDRLNAMRRSIYAGTVMCLLSLFGVRGDAVAQGLQLQLSISPHPSMRIADWQSRRDMATLLVRNTTAKIISARIVASLTLNGSVVASTRTESMPILDVPPGQASFFGD